MLSMRRLPLIGYVLLALEPVLGQLPDPFLRKGLQMVLDGVEPETMRAALKPLEDEAVDIATLTVEIEDEEEKTFMPPKFQNLRQDPIYIDVEADRLILVQEGKEILARDLMFEGNEFEKFLSEVEQFKSRRYIVLLLRPDSAVFQRKLRQIIRDREIDVGFEPWEAGRPIVIERRAG